MIFFLQHVLFDDLKNMLPISRQHLRMLLNCWPKCAMSFHLDIQMLLAFVHVQKQQEKRAEICSE